MSGKVHKINGRTYFKDAWCGVCSFPHIKRTTRWNKVTCLSCLKHKPMTIEEKLLGNCVIGNWMIYT